MDTSSRLKTNCYSVCVEMYKRKIKINIVVVGVMLSELSVCSFLEAEV